MCWKKIIRVPEVKSLTCCIVERRSLVSPPPQTWSGSTPRCSYFPCQFLGQRENIGKAFNRAVQIWFTVSKGDQGGGLGQNRNPGRCVCVRLGKSRGGERMERFSGGTLRVIYWG